MPGLIESKDYAASKELLCSKKQGAADAIDALEWRLVQCTSIDEFPAVGDDNSVRSIVIDATRATPAIVAVFTIEEHVGAEKILLLDVWESEDEDDVD